MLNIQRCLQLILLTLLTCEQIWAGEMITTAKGNKYYVEHQYKYNWYDAFLECTFRNMSLYTIENQAQFEDLYDVLISGKFPQKPPHLFIGAVGVNKRFVWIRTRQPLLTPLWGSGNPDNSGGKENCIQIWQNNKLLNDCSCLSEFGFVCEFVRDDASGNSRQEGHFTLVNEGKFRGLTLNLIQRN